MSNHFDFSWVRARCTGNIPEPRHSHTAVVWRDSMYIFAGHSNAQTNDMYCFCLSSKTWKAVPCWNPPAPRHKHASVLYGDYMILFGGFSMTEGYYSDTHKFSFIDRKWNLLETSGCDDTYKRAGHSAVIHNNTLLVFGGFNTIYKNMNDVKALDLISLKWITVKCGGTPPTPRSQHCACIFNNSMFVFGGNALSSCNDMYSLNLQTWMWQKVTLTGQQPLERRCMSALVVEGQWYIFGGCKSADLCIIDLTNFECKTITASGDVPQARYRHSCVLMEDKMVLFGGQSSYGFGALDETYLFELNLKSDIHRNPIPKLEKYALHDMIFLVQGNKIPAHRCIVSLSEVLAEMIKHVSKNNSHNEIIKVEIPNISVSVFQKVLNYLYSGTILLSEKDVDIYVDIILAANVFQLDGLHFLCLQQFEQVVNEHNFIGVIDRAYKAKVETLKHLCVNYFVLRRERFAKRSDIHSLSKELLSELLSKTSETVLNFEKDNLIGYKQQRDHIAKLYETKEFSDIIFLTKDGKRVKAHRAILVAFSEYFALMFKSAFKESTEREIPMNKLDAKTLDFILQYIYKGNVTLPTNLPTLLTIVAVADMMMMKPLYMKATLRVFDLLTPENALEVLQLCAEHKLDGKIKEKCWKIISTMDKERLVYKLLELQITGHAEMQSQLDHVQQQNKLLREQNLLLQQQLEEIKQSLKKS